MAWESWYDLALRELYDLSDPAKELLAEAAELLPEPADDDEDESEPCGCARPESRIA